MGMYYWVLLFQTWVFDSAYYIPAVAVALATAGYTYVRHPDWCALGHIESGEEDRRARLLRWPRAIAWSTACCELLVGVPAALDRLIQLIAAVVDDATAVRITRGCAELDPAWQLGQTSAERVGSVVIQLVVVAMAIAAVMSVRAWARRRLCPNCQSPRGSAWLFVLLLLGFWLAISGPPPDAGAVLLAILESILPVFLLGDGAAKVAQLVSERSCR